MYTCMVPCENQTPISCLLSRNANRQLYRHHPRTPPQML